MLDAKAVVIILVLTLSLIDKETGQRCKFGKEALDTLLALNPEWEESTTPFIDGVVGNNSHTVCQSGLEPFSQPKIQPWSYECPHRYTKNDTGFRYFPRYKIDAECLCTLCIRKNARSCKKIRADMKVLYIESCSDDGVAAYKLVTRRLTTGCQCEDSIPPAPSGGGPPVTE
ncbi:uncharacterized protein LOC131948389 isoform X2 [Physella acuta]|uniref:uncharacterized protein LOC131948389 isoform X2 n=1 Tax=Physella acuta TaxID=109671 RepID=UPI0027DC075F|nr:uncharacterized protein LOC131948389 isoform X2 [Physella acuta]